MRLFYKISLVALFLSVSVRGAYADIAVITVAPVTRTIYLSRGETEKGTYTIYNSSDTKQHISVMPRYWHMVEKNKDIPIDSWLKITPTELDLEPKEKRNVDFEVIAPPGAVGELAAMIAFKPEPTEEQSVTIVFSVSLYLRIKEAQEVKYQISGIKIWKYEDRKALGFKVSMKNLGNVHLKPRIDVYVRDIFNNDLQKASLKYGDPAYPGMEQDYVGAIYNFELRPGVYKARIYTEFTAIPDRFYKNIYFVAGRDGNVLFALFKKPK